MRGRSSGDHQLRREGIMRLIHRDNRTMRIHTWDVRPRSRMRHIGRYYSAPRRRYSTSVRKGEGGRDEQVITLLVLPS